MKSIPAPSVIGMFFFKSISASLYLQNSAKNPSNKETLTNALPRNVDIATSWWPIAVEYVPITMSGSDVPSDMSVNPIKKLLIFIFFAKATD